MGLLKLFKSKEPETKQYRRIDATLDEIELAHKLVIKKLGEKFFLIHGTLPKNVGVKGDEGIYGDTVLIASVHENPAKYLSENPELIEEVSNKICAISQGITRVLFDITPVLPEE